MVEPNFQIIKEIENNDYGRFIIEPLDQGYGQTLGNSLRRVLLTSLPGYAIKSVKIDGVKHQFSTVSGLKEDVAEFMMKIKKIRLQVTGSESGELKLNKVGPGQITAGDIEPSAGITIVNPDLVLGTLADKKSSLDMIMTIGKGFGYVIAEEHLIQEIGVIPMDALYTPVIRVNYRVESTRVGRMTNLDRLVMDIWTDGSIMPSEALKQSALILMTYFTQVYEPKIKKLEEPEEKTKTISDEVIKMRIEELDIPTRIVNALANGGIETIGQLMETPRSDLMKIKNLGTKSLSIISEKLQEKGVTISV